MATAVHVNGPALIKAGIQGPAGGGTPDLVGITENGPLIDIEFFKEPVIADTGGPNLPVDYQKMGKKAKITFSLPIYDLAVLTAKFLENQKGGAAGEGKLPQIGELMFANTGGFRLIVSSPIDAQPWRFFYCTVDYCRLRPGTKYNVYDVGIDAIAWIGTSTSALDTPLYDHTDA